MSSSVLETHMDTEGILRRVDFVADVAGVVVP